MCWLPRLLALRALFKPQVSSCGLLASSHDIKFNVCAGGSTGTSSALMGMILRLFVTVVGATLGSTLMAVLGAIRRLLQPCRYGQRFFCCSVRLISSRAQHEMNTWRSSLQTRWLADQALNDTRAAISGLQNAASEVPRRQRRPTSARVRSHLLMQERELQGQRAALESIASASLWHDPRLRLRDPEWNHRFMELPG